MTKGIKGNHDKVDVTKSSNVKCEHCHYWEKQNGECEYSHESKMYYNRCKNFKWKSEYLEGTESAGK